MVKQYPHYLFATQAGESIQDENGNWVNTDTTSGLVSMCREETDGRGSEIQVADGTYHKFSALIQLPKGAPRLDVGDNLFVANDIDGTDVRIKGVVLKYDVGQLHSRLWV